MTRKLTFLILALFALISGPGWGQTPTTYTMTIDGSNNGNNNVHWTSTDQPSLTWNDVLWNTSVTGTTSMTASKTYVQIGSKSNPATNVTIKTDDFAGKTITAVSLTGYCMSNTGPSLTVTTGTSTMIDAIALVKTTSTQYSSASTIAPITLGDNDFITFSINSNAIAAICISEITVTYQDTPSATLNHIGIKTAPTKVVYTEGEYFDPTGLVITKYFDDETTSDLAYDENETAFSFNPTLTTPLATTNTQVEITVGGKSANQAITVNAAPKYTITFMDRTNQVDQREINQGAAVGELPADPNDIGTYKFQGWAEQFEGTVQDAPAFVTSTTAPASDMTYYAVYAEVSGSGESTTESSTIEAIASANSWQDAQPYSDASFGNITVTGSGTGNNCKYYTSDKSWRFYSSGDGKITFTVPEGNFISNVTLTGTSYFTSAPTGWNYSNNTFTPKNGTNSNTITISNGSGTSKILSFSITYGGGETYSNYTQNPVAKTLVSIEVSGTPAEFWKGDAFNHDGMTVTANWDDESQTDVTADCEFSTPDMATAGEKEITVTYQGQTDTYTINVQTIANTLETAYSIADAIEIIDAEKDLATEVYVAGKICQIDSYNSQYNSITYWISTDGTQDNMFEVYSGKNLNNTNFTSISDIVLQADVIVYGKIKKFNSTYEFDKNNYLVSYTAPQSYSITLNYSTGGTISADKQTAAEGETVTITIEPASGYTLATLTGATFNETVDPELLTYTFTMPAEEVTISATFNAVPTYTISFTTNGVAETAATIVINQGAEIGSTLPEPTATNIPNGYTFMGWTANDVVLTNVEPTYIAAETIPTGDMTLKAVFAMGETGETTFVTKDIIAEAEITSSVTLNETAYQIGNLPIQLTATKGTTNWPVINSNPTYGNDLRFYKSSSSVTFATTNNSTITKIEFKKDESTASDLKTYFSVNVGTLSANVWTGSANSVRISFSNNDNFKEQMYIINVTYSETAPSTFYNYCTSVTALSGNLADATTVANTAYYISDESNVPANTTATINGVLGNADASLLVIEDGGQLICNNAGVNATVKKSINGYTGDNDNYYLIANPTNVATVAHLNDNNYDLYTFNPAGDGEGNEWINMKSSPAVANGTGYLYANSATTTLEFAGELTPATSSTFDLTYAEEGTGIDFPGFNLIGNPYACNATISGIYTFLKIDGDAILPSTGSVAPCEGIFVEATAAEQSVTFTPALPASQAAAPSAMSIEVSQNCSNVIDRAIVRFDGANDLHKFMLNPDHTNISLAMNGEDFAAVSTSSTSSELPVNFKAEKNGTYTITVNTENIDAEYLHLIDNMTGMDIDVLATPSYTFEAKTSDYASRFKLVFNVNNAASESSDSNFAFMSDGNLVISNIEGEATLQIVDELGRVISTETVSGSYSKALNLKAGLYILNLNGMTQKIVVE